MAHPPIGGLDQRREFSPQGASLAAPYFYLSSLPGLPARVVSPSGWGSAQDGSMADTPYLVALALVEIQGQRALPLNGKSQTAAALEAAEPGDDGRTLALELLLRLWQRSDAGALQRIAGEESLLLLEIPMEVMSEKLPVIKANWLAGGETAKLLASLAGLSLRAWRITIAKYEPISFHSWP